MIQKVLGWNPSYIEPRFIFSLFIYLSVCLFAYLFVYLFIYLFLSRQLRLKKMVYSFQILNCTSMHSQKPEYRILDDNAEYRVYSHATMYTELVWALLASPVLFFAFIFLSLTEMHYA